VRTEWARQPPVGPKMPLVAYQLEAHSHPTTICQSQRRLNLTPQVELKNPREA
jgi:hypothetical protein